MRTQIELTPASPEPLVSQIVRGVTEQITARAWRPGARAPSIRAFAKAHEVSTSTVVEAYDRLVAEGYLCARRGSGFYVKEAGGAANPPHDEPLAQVGIDHEWLLRNVYEQTEVTILSGCGWLPDCCHDVDAVSKGLRQVALHPNGLVRYGSPKGFEPLRQLLTRQLAEWEIEASPSQILLTHGASQALDLLIRRLTKPGDLVFIDDPGYSNLMLALRLQGVRMVGVPMTPTGPDIAALESLLAVHQPRLFFTHTQLQNPTGASYGAAAAFQVLRLAERHQFLVVEDNVCADLVPGRAITLAGADQLRHVIYVGSFSKSIGPGFRVGYLVAEKGLLEELVYFKMISGMSTSLVNERVVYAVLMEGHVRKSQEQLRERLAKAQAQTCRRLEHAGFTRFLEPGAGLFIWARPTGLEVDAVELSRRAAAHQILLAPGQFFRPDQSPSPWLRFNAPYSDNDTLFAFLDKALTEWRAP